jgi:deazaflavin-dependent oxidoreductase (nitroreductase family)
MGTVVSRYVDAARLKWPGLSGRLSIVVGSRDTTSVGRMDFETASGPQRFVRTVVSTRVGSWCAGHLLHHLDRAAFRWSGGRYTVTALVSGLPVVMLTTTGAKTGLPRTVPVLGFPIDSQIAVAAGNFGRRQQPGWCLNLRRTPEATVLVDGHDRTVVAEELAGERREQVLQRALAIYPGARGYADRAGNREIGVFLLRAADGNGTGPGRRRP